MARILLIDDDPQVRLVLEGFLAHDNHEVHSVSNGKEAGNLLKEHRFDLVLTDIVMPDQDGFEIIMGLIKLPDRPRIVAISGGSPNISQQMLLSVASRMPIERVLAKPISYQQLSSELNAVLAAPPKTTSRQTD